ncbi:MAG: hypothetical protein M3229_04085, partial [Actinomycetota bacterium]|nr:hypothetical protein [Actinomycetota bacterium]
FGADGGGAIVLAVGFAVLATLMAGASRRAVVLAAAAAVALVLGLVALDAATGAASHVTRALQDGVTDDLTERVTLSWERATANISTAVTIALGTAVFALLVARLARLSLPLARRALPLAFAASIATSMVVNDSPKDVILAGLVGYLVVEAAALGRDSAAGRARALVASAR